MLHAWMIVLFAALAVHDELPRLSVAPWLGWWAGALLYLAPMVVIGLVQWIIVRAGGRELDRGLWRGLLLADQTLAWCRGVGVVWTVIGVMLIGWLEVVRSVTGDLIALDELLALLPMLGLIVAGWWVFYPIERRLREATLMRSLDGGEPLYPTPTRSAWVLSCVRHQLLLSLVPMTLIGAWVETIDWALPRVAGHSIGAWLASLGVDLGRPEIRGSVSAALGLSGAVVVFVLCPLILRAVWDTTPLGPGPCGIGSWRCAGSAG